MMPSWTHQSGFPLLKVIRIGRTITIFQRPFQPAEFEAIYDETYHGNNYQKSIVRNSSEADTRNSTVTLASTIGVNSSSMPLLLPAKHQLSKKWIFPITYITNLSNNTEIVWMQNVNGEKNLFIILCYDYKMCIYCFIK